MSNPISNATAAQPRLAPLAAGTSAMAAAAVAASKLGASPMAADTLAVSAKAKLKGGLTMGASVPVRAKTELQQAKRTFWARWTGGAAISMAGLGVTALGVMGVNTLPYAAFAGLFMGGLAVMAGGLYLAFTGARRVAEARAHQK